MKLNLLFIVMDLLTLLAYPIVFMLDKIRRFSKSKVRSTLANSLATDSVMPGK